MNDRRSARLLSLVLLAGLMALCPSALAQSSAEPPEDNTLYFLGMGLGRNLQQFELSAAELEKVIEGLRAEVQGKALSLDAQVYGAKLRDLAQTRLARATEREKAAAAAFLSAQAAAEGATRTDSGLIITTLREGTGASPKATDTVKVHYHGTLRDGTVFDSSVERGAPAEFPLNRVIPCWTEGVQRMKVGEKARLVCPAEIAYGDRGAPPRIPGGAALTFEVELIAIGSQ